MISVRSFLPKDAEGVVSLILSIQREEFGIPVTLTDQPDIADIPAFYQRDAGNFWVALRDGLVIGTIALLDIGNRESALRKMFVASSYRGAGHGVAKYLLDTLLSWSRVHDMHLIYLGTTDRFLAAHRFYEKNGFREIGYAELPNSFPIMKIDSKFYVKAP